MTEHSEARTNGHGQALVMMGAAIIGVAWRGGEVEIWQGAAILAFGAMQMLWPWPWRKHT
jgi:hypothetical protein